MRTTTRYTALDHIPEALRIFIGRRCAEACGGAVLGGTAMLGVALMTWSVGDPSLNHATGAHVHNWLGLLGAIAADLLMQLFGLSCVAILIPVVFWGWRLLVQHRLPRIGMRLALLVLGGCCAAGVAALLPPTAHWPLPTGLGGVVGDCALALPRKLFGAFRPILLGLGLVLSVAALLLLSASVGLQEQTRFEDEEADEPPPPRAAAGFRDREEVDEAPGLGLVSVGLLFHLAEGVKALLVRRLHRRLPSRPFGLGMHGEEAELGFEAPFDLASAAEPFAPAPVEPHFDAIAYAPPALRRRAEAQAPMQSSSQAFVQAPSQAPVPVAPSAPPPQPSARSLREYSARPDRRSQTYQPPALVMLSEPKRQAGAQISEDALQQNARLLEGVLDDFGVKGEIINVRPGPVVTLYELEPAPGIKSSRVIGLADDIARSMSALSARVAVVPGRNAIGIELPNQRRETVYLRELLASQDFDRAKQSLPIALGKAIGGEPVIVDLAKMPHLLVAGTTGSGKSVAINTMILSLLYRLKPEECRLIMVDPKMLELSVYDGIPHLLTPVVTDPKKAVVALKWAVREMEDRYKKMAKLGVRNIDGFNARVKLAASKGEQLMRTVQTGYDRDTGEAVYEHEPMDLAPLPYIVVIVDEMADLMMVAGKDIEGAIQRLAQMARAAGIHLIMATQRPSVDVITGTIKANFPTRISFQVTSKIDSRTILGEQGAEQLLGQGDMLHMQGGGRIYRVHGPFVSDADVERVVAHLKTQGTPDYLEITVDEEVEADGEPAAGVDADEAGDLYDRAVAVVLRDRKCSTSYVQRRLQVGYNKAASLIERMEKEGVIGAPNHAGKREILVGGGVDRGAYQLQGADD